MNNRDNRMLGLVLFVVLALVATAVFFTGGCTYGDNYRDYEDDAPADGSGWDKGDWEQETAIGPKIQAPNQPDVDGDECTDVGDVFPTCSHKSECGPGAWVCRRLGDRRFPDRVCVYVGK